MNNPIELITKYLVENKIITDNDLFDIEELLKQEGTTIGNILIDNNYIEQDNLIILLVDFCKNGTITLEEINEFFPIDMEKLLKLLAKSLDLQNFNLDSTDIDYRISEKAPIVQLKKLGALPIKEDEINVYIALKNPTDIVIKERIQYLFNRKLVKIVIADPSKIDKYLNKIELGDSIKGLVADIRKELTTNAATSLQESSAILKLIEVILKTSILARASDIHIEPAEQNCIVRSRIDGMLTETFIFDKDIYPPLSSRMKLLSNMDIAERRKPQDGRFSAQVLEKEYDFRISTLPVMNGESIVLRILDKSKVMIRLENLGMHPKNYEKFSQAMKAPYGIIFVTGPTGSGKTTTLYAALNAIKSIERKIITVEDPVEYQLGMTQQTHVNEKAGLTFAAALRSILRQDPDIIMIGEVRDQETLRIAIQAALTGHLVFSTLHTNDAISAASRVLDMGVEAYLVSGALVAIEAQRLVRKICPHCRAKTILPKSLLEEFEGFLPEDYSFYKSVGCEKCSQTGFLGREMISEIFPISEKISSMIALGSTKEDVKKQAYEEGFIDMFQDGIIRAARGITTVEEVFRVAKS